MKHIRVGLIAALIVCGGVLSAWSLGTGIAWLSRHFRAGLWVLAAVAFVLFVAFLDWCSEQPDGWDSF